jgi:hypothetical protein
LEATVGVGSPWTRRRSSLEALDVDATFLKPLQRPASALGGGGGAWTKSLRTPSPSMGRGGGAPKAPVLRSEKRAAKRKGVRQRLWVGPETTREEFKAMTAKRTEDKGESESDVGVGPEEMAGLLNFMGSGGDGQSVFLQMDEESNSESDSSPG